MRPQDVKKLMGGWSAGTLTEAERQILLNAALDDQELFNTLMAEQPLKELLADPSARAELLAAVQEKPRRSAFLTWWLRPWPMAAAGAMAAALVTVVFLNSGRETAPVMTQRQPEMVARNSPPALPAPVPQKSTVRRVAPTQQTKPAERPEMLTRVEQAPAKPAEALQPELAPPLAKQKSRVESVGVVGGVPGGVIGGIIGTVPGSVPPTPPPARAFRNSLAVSAERADGAAAPVSPFKYTLQKRDADGVFREAAAGSTFAPGEAVIVSVEPPVSGMLRVFENAAQIYSRRVEAGQRYAIPANGAFEIGADGKDRVLLIQIDQLSFPITIPAQK